MPTERKNQEKALEKRLFYEVQKRKGNAVKFFSGFDTGWPDRWVLLPGNRFYQVELKTEGQTPSPLQESKIHWLLKNGFSVWVIDTDQKLTDFLKFIDNDLQAA